MRFLLTATLPALFLSVSPVWGGDIGIHRPYARPAVTDPFSGAAYMPIHNHGDKDDRLLSASSPAAAHVEIHGSFEAGDDVYTRAMENGVEILSHDQLELAPGGIHLVFQGLTELFEDGDILTMTLVFQEAGEMTFRLPVDLDRVEEDGTREHSDQGS